MHDFIDLIYDSLGNIATIGGVWEVPDDFNREDEFALFLADWEPKQSKGKRGKMTKKTLDKRYKAWQRWMNGKYTKVDFRHE